MSAGKTKAPILTERMPPKNEINPITEMMPAMIETVLQVFFFISDTPIEKFDRTILSNEIFHRFKAGIFALDDFFT